MKSFLNKLIPGMVATLAAMALGMFCMLRAQAPKSVSPADGYQATPPSSVTYAPVQEQAAAQVLVCGQCGAQLRQPQAVYVAEPVHQPIYRESYAPRSAYACDVEPIVYAAAYYDRPVRVNPFEEVRVNPIPFPGQVRSIYQPTPGVQYRQHGRH